MISPVYEDLLAKLYAADGLFTKLFGLVKSVPENNFFISGGAVRDLLAGNAQPIKDIDLFFTEKGLETIKGFLEGNGRLVTNQFGTIRWFPYESAGLYYDIILIHRFYNGLWACRDITDVLNQFDITANAVAVDLFNGEFYNPQNGYDDINNKLLRAVRFDFPELLVSDKIIIPRNSVLWFRYNYYAKKLGFEIEPLTLNWIQQNAYRYADLEKFKTYFFDPGLSI